ncbi:hypothetical protein C943_04420 [Mariniradius saccharolyticus AK6]|uniref:Uncharacterized protein n=1 Tax=Mariniradius saccharolyticus AK6 TaxID=1239962 RepID=M7XYH8_9BACT|nr:hypothetical protein C943_04420 [Mariniradius saccharolyticus AK6]
MNVGNGLFIFDPNFTTHENQSILPFNRPFYGDALFDYKLHDV